VELTEAYRFLGLVRGSATRAAAKTAYRTEAKRHHPDAGGTTRGFQRLGEAYELVLDDVEGRLAAVDPSPPPNRGRYGEPDESDGGIDLGDVLDICELRLGGQRVPLDQLRAGARLVPMGEDIVFEVGFRQVWTGALQPLWAALAWRGDIGFFSGDLRSVSHEPAGVAVLWFVPRRA